MKEWIFENYRLIIDVVLLTMSVIIMCIKKKPVKVVDSAKETVCLLLPGLINLAEASGLKGDNKKTFVVQKLHECLLDLGYTTDCIEILEEFARSQVEVILSTPQKKGN